MSSYTVHKEMYRSLLIFSPKMRRFFERGAYLSNFCNLQLESLLHLGQNVITFRTLLHLGQNVVTLGLYDI